LVTRELKSTGVEGGHWSSGYAGRVARTKILECVEEKAGGLYGGSRSQSRFEVRDRATSVRGRAGLQGPMAAAGVNAVSSPPGFQSRNFPPIHPFPTRSRADHERGEDDGARVVALAPGCAAVRLFPRTSFARGRILIAAHAVPSYGMHCVQLACKARC